MQIRSYSTLHFSIVLPGFSSSSIHSFHPSWSEAMAPLVRIQAVERGLARTVVERRSPQAGDFSFWLADVEALSRRAETTATLWGRDASDSQSAATTMTLKPSVKAFVGLMVFIAIFAIGPCFFSTVFPVSGLGFC